MNERAREWKVFRAVVRGMLPADPDTRKEWKAEARQYEEAGMPWLVDGFRESDPESVVASLKDVGITTDQASFVALADAVPGPYEVAGQWVESAQITDLENVDRAWMAARRLWAEWLPDTPSIETAGDAIEDAIFSYEKSGDEEKEAKLYHALNLFVEASEGDRLVADALVSELPVHFWSWLMRKVDGVEGAKNVEEWLGLGEKLALLFPSEPVFRLAIARFRHRHGQHGEAQEEVAAILSGQPPVPFLLYQGAETYHALGLSERALGLAERGLSSPGDEQDDQDGAALITKIMTSLGRGEEAANRIAQARAERKRGELEKRKDRRRRDKKNKRRRK